METARWSYLNIQSFRPLCVTARKTKHAFCERLHAFLLVDFLFDHILYLWNNNVIIHDKTNLHVHYIIFFIWQWKLYLSTIHNIYMYLHVHFLLFWRVHYSSIPHYAGKKPNKLKWMDEYKLWPCIYNYLFSQPNLIYSRVYHDLVSGIFTVQFVIAGTWIPRPH